MNALAYVDIDQGIHKEKMNVAWSENYAGFLIIEI